MYISSLAGATFTIFVSKKRSNLVLNHVTNILEEWNDTDQE